MASNLKESLVPRHTLIHDVTHFSNPFINLHLTEKKAEAQGEWLALQPTVGVLRSETDDDSQPNQVFLTGAGESIY